MKITINNNLNKYANLHLHTRENSPEYVSSNIAHNFDAITIQSNPRQIEERTFAEAVAKKLSSDISNTVPEEKLQKLEGQIADGTYQIDPHAIAFKILLMGEDM